MAGPEVRNLDTLLRDALGKDKKIVDYKTRYLTGKGDNYGSVMLALDLMVQQNGSTEVIQTVAKCIPATEYQRELFCIQDTFYKEIQIYRDAAPALTSFQRESGLSEEKILDVFPKFYGARLCLDDSNKIDDDAVICLENVAVLGYATGDRLKGFDLEETQVILKNLARFHAVPIALKTLKPEKFKTDVLPSLQPFLFGTETTMNDMKSYASEVKKFFLTVKDLAPYADKAADYIHRAGDFHQNFLPPKEPLATIIHNDFWVNNMMLLKKNGKTTKLKFVDYQVTVYGSPVRDILFFFFTSIQDEVLKNNFDNLFDYYHKQFIECLHEFKLDVTVFSKEAFEKEMEEYAIHEFGHILMIMQGVLSDKEKIKSLDLNSGVFNTEVLSSAYFTRIVYLFRYYLKRGWFK